MKTKDFSRMTPQEKDAEARKWEGGIDFNKTRPMSKRSQTLWEIAKRGRGRPRKPASERAKRVLISLDPRVFALVEKFTAATRLDRSKLFALSVQAFIAAEKDNASSPLTAESSPESKRRRRRPA